MLKNVKSKYIIKIIFAYVDYAQKLILIKYAKSFQMAINISIINYKLFSGKYIIYESNGIGKEYDGYSDELIFEGEYLNGKRNGKGKEYYGLELDQRLKFEGEYLNGKRNGKGKEYKYGGLSFEGEYLNGNRNGKGKEYNNFNKLIFEGEYLNNKEWIGTKYDSSGKILYKLNNNINRKGKVYIEQGKLIFEGEYFNGKRNGLGKEYGWNNALMLEGGYKNDYKWNDKGYNPWNKIVYELKDRKGIVNEYNEKDKLVFKGKYVNGKRNGEGKEYNEEGELIFEGEYLNGKRNGKGKEYNNNSKLKFESE